MAHDPTDPFAEERLIRLVAAELPHRDLRTIRRAMRCGACKPSVVAEVELALARIRAAENGRGG